MSYSIFAKSILVCVCTALVASVAAAESCSESLKSTVDRYQQASLAAATATRTAADKVEIAAAQGASPSAQADADNAKAAATAAGVTADAASGELHRKLTFDGNTVCLVAAILSNPAYTQTLTGRAKAAFQQNGPSSGSGGSTNVVSKGTAAKVLALASEYGALTESVSGQTVTVSGTLAGFPTLLEQENILQPCTNTIAPAKCISPNLLSNLNRFSYSVAFAGNQNSPQVSASAPGSTSSTQPTTFNASYKSVNAVTAKGMIVKGASAKPADITKAISALQSGAAPNIKPAADAVDRLKTAFGTALASSWQTIEFNKLKVADQLTAASEWSSWSESLPKYLCGGNSATCATLQADAAQYAQSYFEYLRQQNVFIEGLRNAPVLSAEYDWNLPTSQTSNSTFRAIAAFPVSSTPLTVTANGAVSLYNGMPSTTVPGARILRDFQAAAELAYTFGSKTASFLGQSTASVAYYYQDQTSPSILNVTPGQPVPGVTFTGLPSTATQVFAQRGVINLAQMKFNFIPGKGSINVPLSVTWSNRTELVTQSVWRGQVGISYDFDSLFSGLGK